MALMLTLLTGKYNGKEIRVKRKQYLIGRDSTCQLRPRTTKVSRKHCELLITEPDVILRDLGSRNGTFVNGQRVKDQRVLADGDLVVVGVLKFRVTITTLRPAVTAAPATAADDVLDQIGEASVGDTDILDEEEYANSQDLAGADPLQPHPRDLQE